MNETTFETEQEDDIVTEPVSDNEMAETTFSEVVTTVSDFNISDQLASLENNQRASLHVLLAIFFTIAGYGVCRLFGSFFKM